MKKTIPIICTFMFICTFLFSQEKKFRNEHVENFKSGFDIHRQNTGKRLKSALISTSRKMLTNDTWEYALMQYGYFTLGTKNGLTDHFIDDHCQLSYGHPYALTSFPYPVIDGIKLLPHELRGNSDTGVEISADTLIIRYFTGQKIHASLRIHGKELDNLEIEYRLINHDSVSHQAGMGLLYDVALGKWGDGHVETDGHVIDSVTSLSENIDSFTVWERRDTPRGIGMHIQFKKNSPDRFIFGNWYDEYTGENFVNRLYDLALHAQWEEKELGPGDTLSFTMNFSLTEPEYHDQPFIRWDMPNALSIENNQLFPSRVTTNVEILGHSGAMENLTLKLKKSDYNYAWESRENFSAGSSGDYTYQQCKVHIPEIYDSIVIPYTLYLEQSGQHIDKITRNVFIPAAPYADIGLNVYIDTAFTGNGRMNLSFHCEKEETGQFLYNLHRNNIFVYENGQPVEEFNVQKDTSGGTNKADIIFVLDVTGSMTNEIAGVRDNIKEFTDSLSYRGTDYRLGMVTFLDVIENIYDFTDDVQQFQLNVDEQYAHGGGDGPENSLDALSVASEFNFRDNSNRIIIWITDADFHINNHNTQLTKESVIDQLLAKGIQVHCIGSKTFQTDYYDQITLSTGGSYFDINGNFRDILLEVSRLNQVSNYLLSFYTDEPVSTGDIFTIEVHYAGLGGEDSIIFGHEKKSFTRNTHTKVDVFPNPFNNNPHIQIRGSKSDRFRLELYNLQGQLIDSKIVYNDTGHIHLTLGDLVKLSDIHSGQVYLLKTTTMSKTGIISDFNTIKITKY